VRTPERWWIVDPVGHRQQERKQQPEVPEWAAAQGMTPDQVIVVMPGDDDDWVCDLCNDPVPLENDDGDRQWVPMLTSHALCPRCFARHAPGPMVGPLDWSRVLCGCDACSARAVLIEAEIAASRSEEE
jgi:hypothetical protein